MSVVVCVEVNVVKLKRGDWVGSGVIYVMILVSIMVIISIDCIINRFICFILLIFLFLIVLRW